MLYPQNGDSFVTIDSVTSLYTMYTHTVLCTSQSTDSMTINYRVAQD